MDTQTMIQTLEENFVGRNTKEEPKTLAEAISNNLCSVLPRISPELFNRKREATVSLTEKQISSIDKIYMAARHVSKWDINRLNPIKVCKVVVPIFAYASVPEQMILTCGNAAVTYEENLVFNTGNGKNCGFTSYYFDGDGKFGCTEASRQASATWAPSEKGCGSSIILIKSVWTAPLNLGVSVNVPRVIDAIAELSDLAMFYYYKEATTLCMSDNKTSLKKPKLGVLWAPTDEALYCTGEIQEVEEYRVEKKDPALVLEIPDEHTTYRHVIATWDCESEKPFKNWLAEYTE